MTEFIAQEDMGCSDCDMELPKGSTIFLKDDLMLCSECAAGREEVAGYD